MVGLLSSIVTLYESCSEGYAKFTNARDLEKTYATLFMKLRIEEARFHVWGRGWGIQDGKIIEEAAVAEVLRRVVEDVLQQMDRLLRDSVQLSSKYAIRESSDVSSHQPDGSALGGGTSCSDTSQTLVSQSSRSGDTNAGGGKEHAHEASSRPQQPHTTFGRNIRKRASWAISDKDKFELLVSELRYFNDSLYAVLPLPVRQYLLQAALPSEVLRTNQQSELRAIYDASSGSYDVLARAANIRNLNVTHGQSSSFTTNLSPAMLKIAKGEIELERAEKNAATATAGLLPTTISEPLDTTLPPSPPHLSRPDGDGS